MTLLQDAKTEAAALEAKDVGWVKLHRVALIVGFVIGALVGYFVKAHV